jgi:hypothetical protein
MAFCDGCGSQVDDAHIRRRIERLELATRFRPIHIQVLLIDAAPPINDEDYFYRAAGNREEHSVVARMYFDEIVKSAKIELGADASEEAALAEFQRRGFFLASAVECPVDSSEALSAALNRLAPVIVKRVNASYKPKYIAPISPPLEELVPLFELSGWGERLVLNDGKPFVDPFLGDPQAQAEFGTSLGERLAEALSSRS